MRRHLFFANLNVPTLYKTAAIFLIFGMLGYFKVISVSNIQHDDWPFILGKNVESVPYNVLNEGRWLAYLWFRIDKQTLTPILSNLIFWTILSTVTLDFIRDARVQSASGIIISAMLVLTSRPIVMQSGWPVSDFPALVLLILGAYVMRALQDYKKKLLALGIFVVLISQVYPHFCFVLLALAVAMEPEKSLMRLSGLCAALILGLGVSILISYAINYFAYGILNVPPQAWRQASFANDARSAVKNLSMGAASDLGHLISIEAVTFLAVCGAIYHAIFDRKLLIYTIVAVSPAIFFDLAVSTYTGIAIPGRTFFWWPFFAVFLVNPFVSYLPERIGIAIAILLGLIIISDLDRGAGPRNFIAAVVNEAKHASIVNGIDVIRIVAPKYGVAIRSIGYQLAYDGYKIQWCTGISDKEYCDGSNTGRYGTYISDDRSAVIVSYSRP